MPRPSKWSVCFRFPHQSPVCISLLPPHVPHTPKKACAVYSKSEFCCNEIAQLCSCCIFIVLDVQAVAEQIAQERDAAEREAREKETRVLSLTREIDEMNEKVEELERGRRQLQAELDELVNNQGTADKNVSVECLRLL